MVSGKNTTYKKIQYWKKHKVQGKQFTKETKGQRLPLTLNNPGLTHWKLLGVPMSAFVNLFFFPPLTFFSLLGKEECTMLFI